MNELEKVVNVSQKLGITYEDAKKYLDAHNWDEAEVIAFVESERKEEEESKRRAEEAAKIAMEAARQAVADEQIKNSNEDTVEEGTIFTGKVEGNQKEENKTMNGFKNVCKKIWQVAKNILKKEHSDSVCHYKQRRKNRKLTCSCSGCSIDCRISINSDWFNHWSFL